MEIGEFDFIERLRNAFPAVSGETLGIGDDCAVIRMPSAAHLDASGTGLTPGSELLVSTDLLLEGVHFLRDSISPWQLGWKAAAVNFSDIAAMGGRPRWTFLSIAIPQEGTDSRAELRTGSSCFSGVFRL